MTDSLGPAEYTDTRQCARTGLRLVRTAGREAVRVARLSYGALNPVLREESPSSVDKWGRWDILGGRTIYTADHAETAYREVLAYLAPSAGVRDTRLDQVFTEDDQATGGPHTLLEAIAAEWGELWHIEPRMIVRGWRDARLLYELMLPVDGWCVDVEHQDSIDALNRGLAQHLAAAGISRLTREHACGENRDITTYAALWIHGQVLDDGSLPHGITYPSKHGSNGTCWALWLRRVDDGHDPSTEPTTVTDEHEIKDPQHDTALKAAADAFGLTIL